MEYDYEFITRYQYMMISTRMHTRNTQNSTRTMQDEKAQTFRHSHICIMLADIRALDYDALTHMVYRIIPRTMT